jgi:hypothetical protein
MKRQLFLMLLACALTFSATQTRAAWSMPTTPKAETKTTGLLYLWFLDIDLLDPVGSFSDINTELARLRTLFPGYTFSATPTPGLRAFEFGFYPLLTIAIIYSDL